MSENCGGNCSSCGEKCEKRDMHIKPHEGSRIGKIIGVVSGKGGVGKTMVTSMLAVVTARRGYKTAILDADITGPSVAKAMGLTGRTHGTPDGMYPLVSSAGIKVISVNMLLENETDPVVWRGPILANVVKQFFSEVLWGDIDYMYVDMPPGTGDVPLTVYQSIPLDGVVIVSTPQELVGMIVEKAVKMADFMNIPVLGLVENMSYFECPECGRRYHIFGASRAEEAAKAAGAPVSAQIPVVSKLSTASDHGLIELYEGDWLKNLTDSLLCEK